MLLEDFKKKIWRWQRIIRSRLGSGSKLDSPDRHFQEVILIPTALNGDNTGKVLYTGVSWYTYHYYKTLFKSVDLTTVDISSEQAVYGSKKHVIGDLAAPELTAHGPFDVIFLLGVLNYGINDAGTLRQTLKSLDRYLTADGCCYLTVEEQRSESRNCEFDAASVVRIFESMNYYIQPISDWFNITGGNAIARFFVASKSRQTLEAAQSRFANRPTADHALGSARTRQ